MIHRTLTAACWLFAASAAAFGQGFSPEDAVRRMTLADGFEVSLVAAEPDIRQPLSVSFDERGRMWVVQYIQYPTPAGLKAVTVDQFLRTEYDRIPEPPPKGPKGHDRITICEDTNGDGRADRFTDFISDLNLCTGLAVGHGGVFVLQSPYLLFYADRDGDDRPDGDPEVLLSGFGMQDSHAYANSLQWGPDGWLYGVQGSTVTAKIRGIEFQQGIWRYHPKTKAFELFSEGGGNTWGLDFDRHGRALASTNYGHSVGLHQVQGGYYVKGFSKHGPLHNPHTYGYFEHMPYTGKLGGHVTIGGLVYRGGAFPEAFRDTFIGANILSNAVYWSRLVPRGSTFAAEYAGTLLDAHDTWFRPVDMETGPDGAIYLADWYDQRANHVDPVDNWDRTNGRIYRIAPKGLPRSQPFDLRQRGLGELVKMLDHPNNWLRREVRRQLAERGDRSIHRALWALIRERTDDVALEAVWGLAVTDGIDDAATLTLLDHAHPGVRMWAVRLAGDTGKLSSPVREKLVQLAGSEPSPMVRSQLACSAKRWPAADGLPIVRRLLQRTEDVTDLHLPLLLWWAIEDKAVSERDRVLALLDGPAAWREPITEKFIVERLARRFMAAGDHAACAVLLSQAPTPADTNRVLAGMEQALEGKRLTEVPAPLQEHLQRLWGSEPSLPVVRWAVRLGSTDALDYARRAALDPKGREADRVALIGLLGQVAPAESITPLLEILSGDSSAGLRGAALAALQASADPRVATAVQALYGKLPASLRARAQALLLSRPASALPFLQAVDAGQIDKASVPVDLLRGVVALEKPEITKLVEKHWGRVGPQQAGEKTARIRAVNLIISRGGLGEAARGKPLFTKHCATCHSLFGEGQKIGPELTGADRKNRLGLLTHIIDPSGMIRPEYVAFKLATVDGRVLTGLVAEQTDAAVTLIEANAQKTVVPRDQIDEMAPSPQSLMPEKLLDTLTDQEIRDLFAYLQADAPPAAPAAEKPAAAAPVKKLTVCLVSGSLEYKSDDSLKALQADLEANYPITCTRAFRKTDTDIPGLEQLAEADVMLLFTRRLKPEKEQLERIQAFCRSNKGVVGVRTASHALQNWLAIDREVFGGDYQGHFGHDLAAQLKIVPGREKHPLLTGVTPFLATGGLYKNPMPAKDVEVLMTGTIPGQTEPVTWHRQRPGGGRSFYTSLGHPKDFEQASFRRLLANAIFWSAGQDVPKAK